MNRINSKCIMAIIVVIAGVIVSFVGCNKETVISDGNSSIIENDNKLP